MASPAIGETWLIGDFLIFLLERADYLDIFCLLRRSFKISVGGLGIPAEAFLVSSNPPPHSPPHHHISPSRLNPGYLRQFGKFEKPQTLEQSTRRLAVSTVKVDFLLNE